MFFEHVGDIVRFGQHSTRRGRADGVGLADRVCGTPVPDMSLGQG